MRGGFEAGVMHISRRACGVHDTQLCSASIGRLDRLMHRCVLCTAVLCDYMHSCVIG